MRNIYKLISGDKKMYMHLLEKDLFKVLLTGIKEYSTDSKGRISIPSDLLKIISPVNKSDYFYTSIEGVFKGGIVIIPECIFEQMVPRSSSPSYNRWKLDSQNRILIDMKNQDPAYIHGCGNILLVHQKKLFDTEDYFKKHIIEKNVHRRK